MLARLRNAQIVEAQDRFIRCLISEQAFAEQTGRDPLHGRMLDGLPQQPQGCRALELGCGPGRYAAMLAKVGFDVVAVDPMPFPSWEPIRRAGNVEFRDGVRAEALPFGDAAFDAIVCSGALLYFADPGRALDEMFRVLRPKGRLVLRTVNRNNLFTRRTGRRLDPASRQLYSMGELRELVAHHGFQITESFASGFWPPFTTDLWWYLQTVWLSDRLLGVASRLTPAEHRVMNNVFARKA